jgi:hypothetical protein
MHSLREGIAVGALAEVMHRAVVMAAMAASPEERGGEAEGQGQGQAYTFGGIAGLGVGRVRMPRSSSVPVHLSGMLRRLMAVGEEGEGEGHGEGAALAGPDLFWGLGVGTQTHRRGGLPPQ